ncbi:MAG TPA: DUF3857 domain-containing protein [Parafilimonas sp.]|nr:DUF3857 domain-containing protein [Parafilimonas sp.]
MKNILFFVLASYICASATAQNYNALLIPDSLTKHANVVGRFEELHIIIKDIDKAIIRHKYARTILNEAGNKYAPYINDYSRLVDLSDIDGNLYDALGKKLKNVKKKDIADFSDDDEALATDSRLKAHNFFYFQYPYTVEYEDEQHYNGIFYLPRWQPERYENFSVQESILIVETPVDYKLRYKQANYPGEPVITQDKDKMIYTWRVKNQPARYVQPYSPPWEETITSVLVAPTQFSIQGFAGSMDTWQNFGTFCQALAAGRDELDDATKKKVHEITDTIKDQRRKIAALYKYLQQNTRYINIQFGIGGWQPFDAKYVAQKKYGDCKALSNFMGALLKEAGINSYYTVIKAGENKTFFWPDFPSTQFNHAIRCVPLGEDTMWLECTSETLPAGYLGDFTCNRPALLITETGGKLVRTPYYSENDNQYSRKIEATLNENGDLTANVATIYKGLEYDDVHNHFHYLNKEDLKKYLNESFDVSSYEINDFKYDETNASIPSITEQISFLSNSYAHVSGKRLFITPNIVEHNPIKLDTSEKRTVDIYYPYSFQHTDTFYIAIPAGYTVESVPKNMTVSNKFGSYEATYAVSDDKISYTRLYKRVLGRFPASDYPEFVKFYNDMYKADRSQVVLVKKTN